MTVRLIVGAATDVGRVRGHNEDAYLVDEQLGLVAVADGMGGHQAGEVASATALEALRAAVTSGEGIRDAVTSANAAVYDKSTTDERLRGMGTTLTAATLATGATLLLGHVGDSRAYLLHDGKLQRLTTDHSLVEELIQSGELTPEEAEADPRRSMITRALGIEPDVDVDLYPTQLSSGDRLLFCSDGLTGMVSEEEIRTILVDDHDPSAAARRLIAGANTAGGIDNITVLVVDVVDDEEPTAAVPAVTAAEEPIEEPPRPTGEPAPAVARRQGQRRRLWRIVRWGLPIIAVVGVAIGVLYWYARNTYYVGTDLGNVAIFRGRPGGVLIWNPTIVGRRTEIVANNLPPRLRQEVRGGHGQFSSVSDARAYVRRLSASTTTTTTTVTTPATTTPTAPKPAP
jgi:serine/threonine protein phosphatase PrpC